MNSTTGAGSTFETRSVGIRHAIDPVRTPQGQVAGPVETRSAIDPDARVAGTARVNSNGTTPDGATRTTGTSEGATQATSTAEAVGTNTTAGTEAASNELSANASGTQSTEASEPGFGAGVAVVALLAIGSLAMRRQ